MKRGDLGLRDAILVGCVHSLSAGPDQIDRPGESNLIRLSGTAARR
jgi:hypothetical protein